MEENVNMCAFILQLPSSQRSDVRVPVSWDGRVVILVHAHFVCLGREAIGNPVLRRKSSFTFHCSWALYGHVIHFGHRGIISSNNVNAAISPTENCHYQAFYRLKIERNVLHVWN